MKTEECLFCKAVAGEWAVPKLWEDKQFLAFLDSRPVHPGHTLIIPKAHVNSIFNVDEPVYVGLFEAARILAEPIRQFAGTPRIGFAVEGFGVPHAHLHVVPLNHGGELLPDRSKAPLAPKAELEKVAEAIRAGYYGSHES